MRIETFIEGINNYIKAQRQLNNIEVSSFFVVNTYIEPDTKFPIYKHYKLDLYCIHDSSCKIKMYSINHTSKDSKDKSWEEVERMLVEWFCQILSNSDTYNEILKDNLNRYNDFIVQ